MRRIPIKTTAGGNDERETERERERERDQESGEARWIAEQRWVLSREEV